MDSGKRFYIFSKFRTMFPCVVAPQNALKWKNRGGLMSSLEC